MCAVFEIRLMIWNLCCLNRRNVLIALINPHISHSWSLVSISIMIQDLRAVVMIPMILVRIHDTPRDTTDDKCYDMYCYIILLCCELISEPYDLYQTRIPRSVN